MRTLNKLARLGVMVILLSAITACGQKGDLYLPKSALTAVEMR